MDLFQNPYRHIRYDRKCQVCGISMGVMEKLVHETSHPSLTLELRNFGRCGLHLMTKRNQKPGSYYLIQLRFPKRVLFGDKPGVDG